MKFHAPTLISAAALAAAAQMVSAQEITPKWYQHINGNLGVAEADLLPILKKQTGLGPEADTLANGTSLLDSYANLMRYDADRLLLAVRENGINETDPGISPADAALAAAYPDRSLIWLDAETGKPLGIAWRESFTAAADIGIDVTSPDHGSMSNDINQFWRVALDEGPAGQRALYSTFKHIILRYAPKDGGGWETTPTVAYEEQVSGVGDELTVGDGANAFRFREIQVKGSSTSTMILAGGGTWRAGQHPQIFKTTDGLNFVPVGRVDNRDNGARRNDYALGGLTSFPMELPSNYGGAPGQGISVVYASHYPGTGWEARPNRYTSNPLNPSPSPAYNNQPDVAMYLRNESAFGGLPAFSWEAAGKDGRPINHEVDGVERYDGNWNMAIGADPALDYMVAYSSPSWNNQFGEIKKPAWVAIHRHDGSIASGNSSLKLDFTEVDEEPNTQAYLYDAWVNVYPDTSAEANLDKSEALVTFGTAGFGVFTVQNVAASLVSSPGNQTVAAGTDVTLAANVTGSPNHFQWYKDGEPLPAAPQYQGTTRKVALTILGATAKDAGVYQLRWTNPISGAGQTTEATLGVTGQALRLTAVQIQPEVLPIVIPEGSVTATGADAFTVEGPGLVAFPSASNPVQPGDIQEFAYESITGDFDKIVKITSITSGPVTDPVDALASGGLQARATLDPLSPSFLINVSNPAGEDPAGGNQVTVRGRAIDGQNYTAYGRSYPGVDATLPNQWLRLRRVGDWFAAYVGTDGVNWALVGQRYQQWPATLLVGTYAFSASYVDDPDFGPSGGENLASVQFSNYGDAVVTDVTPPRLVSAGTGDKMLVGVKFSEPVKAASAVLPINYKLSQGTITAVRMGIGGDSVYLTVDGLTADSFTVTVLGGVTDTAGNPIAANSEVTARASNWASADIGLIQDPENRPTPGDDPYRVGQAVAVSSGDTETEIEIVGGGSNAWNPGDYVHYVSNATPLVGDFDVMVEVSRNDRPANTAAWANSGLMLRESVYLPGQEFTPGGTLVPMVANTTYIENAAPNRAGIPLWREEEGGGYGNGNAGFGWTTPINGIKGYYLEQRAVDAAGTPDPESSPMSSRWLRVTRSSAGFMFYVSYDGTVWEALDPEPADLPLGNQLLFGFSSMNDTGSAAPPGNAYAGNGMEGTDLEGNQNASNYSVQRIRIGTNVAPRSDAVVPTITLISSETGVQILYTGTLEAAETLGGAFTAVPGASSPYTVPPGTSQIFYRASN